MGRLAGSTSSQIGSRSTTEPAGRRAEGEPGRIILKLCGNLRRKGLGAPFYLWEIFLILLGGGIIFVVAAARPAGHALPLRAAVILLERVAANV